MGGKCYARPDEQLHGVVPYEEARHLYGTTSRAVYHGGNPPPKVPSATVHD